MESTLQAVGDVDFWLGIGGLGVTGFALHCLYAGTTSMFPWSEQESPPTENAEPMIELEEGQRTLSESKPAESPSKKMKLEAEALEELEAGSSKLDEESPKKRMKLEPESAEGNQQCAALAEPAAGTAAWRSDGKMPGMCFLGLRVWCIRESAGRGCPSFQGGNVQSRPKMGPERPQRAPEAQSMWQLSPFQLKRAKVASWIVPPVRVVVKKPSKIWRFEIIWRDWNSGIEAVWRQPMCATARTDAVENLRGGDQSQWSPVAGWDLRCDVWGRFWFETRFLRTQSRKLLKLCSRWQALRRRYVWRLQTVLMGV